MNSHHRSTKSKLHLTNLIAFCEDKTASVDHGAGGEEELEEIFFILVEVLAKSPCSHTGCRWAGRVNCRVDEKLAVQIRIKANSSKSNRQPTWGTVSQELILRLMNQLNESMNLCQ